MILLLIRLLVLGSLVTFLAAILGSIADIRRGQPIASLWRWMGIASLAAGAFILTGLWLLARSMH